MNDPSSIVKDNFVHFFSSLFQNKSRTSWHFFMFKTGNYSNTQVFWYFHLCMSLLTYQKVPCRFFFIAKNKTLRPRAVHENQPSQKRWDRKAIIVEKFTFAPPVLRRRHLEYWPRTVLQYTLRTIPSYRKNPILRKFRPLTTTLVRFLLSTPQIYTFIYKSIHTNFVLHSIKYVNIII